MAGFISPASAAQHTAVHMTEAAHPAVTGPNTNIVGPAPVHWKPTKLTIPPVTGTCSSTNYSFTITNKTAKARTILYKTGTSPKQTLGTVKAHAKEGICASGPKGAKAKFFIKGATSVLTVTLS
jgi:hypothetical protein